MQPPRVVHGASNAWAVAGERTRTGLPLLANDPHLSLETPIQWYLARVVTPEASLAGATVPGLPYFVAGHNGRIAWGLTGAEADIEDLFLERLSEDGTKAATPGGEVPLRVRTETIAVRGGDPVELRIRSTPNGPLLPAPTLALANEHLAAPASPNETAEAGTADDATIAVALGATYLLGEGGAAEALHGLNAARNWPQFRAAAALHDTPPMNLLYADRAGNVARILAGLIPLRPDDQGSWPRPGWLASGPWRGWLPRSELPEVRNPPQGFVANANERAVPASFAWYVSDGWAPGLRAARIEALLSDARGLDLDDMAAAQLDVGSEAARRLLPVMLTGLPAGARQSRAARALAAWDRRMTRDAPEPALFATWLRALDRALFADELGADYRAFQGFRPLLIKRVLRRQASWCDDVGTPAPEDCADRLAASLEAAQRELARSQGEDPGQWRWGALHRARFAHPLLGRLLLLSGFAATEIETDGGWDTLNRGAYKVWDDERPFSHVHGPGLRALYDLSDLDRSRFMIALGQSGNPFSRHFDDLLRAWRDGRWLTLGGDREEIEARARSAFTLSPAPPAPPAPTSSAPPQPAP
jgi:penicillin amidase